MRRLVFNSCALAFQLVALTLFITDVLGPADRSMELVVGLVIGNAIGANICLAINSYTNLREPE